MCLSAERNQFYATKYLNAHEKFKKQMAAAYSMGGWNQNGIHRKKTCHKNVSQFAA